MIEVILATHNENKVNEFRKILNNKDVIIYSLKDLGDNDQVIENEETLVGNALIKAKYFLTKYNKIIISDDTGLFVKVLDGMPGVRSARFSKNVNVSNNDLLLKKMYNKENRMAYFETSLVILLPNGKKYIYKGRIDGKIALEPRGSNGFGYDSLFIIEKYNKTFAELDSDVKNEISHRALAFKKGMEKLNEIINYK